jgi:hypothetical protein
VIKSGVVRNPFTAAITAAAINVCLNAGLIK